ncbi:MAG: ATP-binding protein [Steroidobacteraceae bacterium]|jgi:anti-sigma regulatory factor (Ser/Thr protein kinase)
MTTELSSQIVMQAKLDQLPKLERWVEALAAELVLPPALVHRIDLCVTELVTNLICYGYPNGAAGTVRIHGWRQGEQVIIRIEDDGIPFDPISYASPELPSSLAEAAVGGRGIRLVRHFTDALHHVRRAGGNELTLLFRSPDAGARSPAVSAAREFVSLDPAR